MTSNNTQEADARGNGFSDLIARLEKATGPDRVLDAAMGCAVHIPGTPYPRIVEGFTASIDAALTLVPEGFAIEGLMIWTGHSAHLSVLGTHLERGEYWHSSADGRWKAEAATTPLAVCIAALKSRQPLPSPPEVEK